MLTEEEYIKLSNLLHLRMARIILGRCSFLDARLTSIRMRLQELINEAQIHERCEHKIIVVDRE
jgi:hypothetical protein